MSEIITHPRIGIRPTIDGRENGVRESLEIQTIAMANKMKEYIEKNFFYPDGKRVEVVMAPNTIGRAKEAADCEQLFQVNNVCASITVTPCWCYGMETMDMHPTRPKAIWGFNGTERPGAVYLNAVLSAHNQLGLPAYGMYGSEVMDKDAVEIPEDIYSKIDGFVSSALAVGQMNGKSYLQIGGISMGIAGSAINYELFNKYLGMRVEQVDMVEILRRIDEGIYDPVMYEKARKWVSNNCVETPDTNKQHLMLSDDEIELGLDFVTKMSIIIKDMMNGNEYLRNNGNNEEGLGHNAIVAGFQGQRQWTDYMPNGDFSETLLNSSFDWTGTKRPNLLATENDTLNGATMLFGYLLTNCAQVFCDVRTYWSPQALTGISGKDCSKKYPKGLIHLINSGSAALDGTGRMKDKNETSVFKPFWNVNENDIKACLDNTKWPVANREYFRGGGFSTNYLTVGDMPFTMSRLNIVNGKPTIQIIEGYSQELSEELYCQINDRTDPTWPSTFFVPKDGTAQSTYEIMNNWGANHCVLSFGHIGDKLVTLSSMLRIPVSLHNIEEDRIYRPTMWSHYGLSEPIGADFRACEILGPLYE